MPWPSTGLEWAVLGSLGFFAAFSLLLLLLAALREMYFSIPAVNPTQVEIAVDTVLHQGLHDRATLTEDRRKFLRSHSRQTRRSLAILAPSLPKPQYENARALYDECSLGWIAVKDLLSWNRNARLAAAHELGALQYDGGVPGLLGLVKSPDMEARAIAARALARIGRVETVVHVLDAFPGVSRSSSQAAAEAAIAFGAPAAPELQRAVLNAPERHLRLHAIEALGLLQDRASVPLLIDQLRSADPEVRTRAARALGNLGDATAGDALMLLLSDPTWEARAAAALSLGQLGISEASPYLARATMSNDWWVRHNAEEALGKIASDLHGAASLPPPAPPGEPAA